MSGGTIAFILGFYDDFVNSLNNLISNNKQGRIIAIKFLSKIGIGWIVGFILSVLFITSVFEKNIYQINSLFLGFIISSIPLIVKSEQKTLISNKKNIIFLIIGIIIVGTITYFNPVKNSGQSFSVKSENLNLLFIAYIFIVGMIAISAMVLPGISGSTILLIFGLYAPILNAIKQVIKLNFNYLPVIVIFGSGILIGILITVRIVRYLLRSFRSPYFNPVTNGGQSFSIKYDNLNMIFIAYIFISGMIAISAMVLPGISGSTILLIFGLYAPILNAIKQVIKLNFDYLPAIIIFGCGVLIGILVTVTMVRYLLRNFRSQTIYCIIGLMIGSIYAVIMGPTSLEITSPPMSIETFNILFFLIGCTLVPALEKLKSKV